MAILYGTMQNGQLVAVEADAQGRLVAQLAGGDAPRYQQGTWTPTLSHGTVGSAACSWSRIGNTVTIRANLISFSDTTTPAQIEITGIPYHRDKFVVGTIRTSYLNYGEGSSPHSTLNTGDIIRVGKSTPTIGGTAAPAASYVNYSNFISAQASNTQLVFDITYLTEDTTWAPINGATVS